MHEQLNLWSFGDGADPWEVDTQWSDADRFPYNYGESNVESVVVPDLSSSCNPLIITGYTSVAKLVDFLADCYEHLDTFERIRILLGNEPTFTQQQEFRLKHHSFSQQIKDYWLERGISIRLCGKIIAAIELLKTETASVRISGHSRRLIHAKIYKGDRGITLGSSNFSYSGLRHQIEGNTRFTQQEATRFQEASLLAENIWNLGKDYKSELIDLLKQLLREVSWQEALARACAELLEGEWAKRYVKFSHFDDDLPLWLSQEQGIAQALWVIANVGSVLVADATGSGKTRMGAHLLQGVMNRIWGIGRMRQNIPVLICPPNVIDSWEREFTLCGGQNPKIYSHGRLRYQDTDSQNDITLAIRRTQVLAVDEAHNFLNRGTLRTKALFNNMADHVILFTATPINRGCRDLLAIIDLLGADNFDDKVLGILDQIFRRRRGSWNEKISSAEQRVLQRELQRFIVRRTKTMLNNMVDKDPSRYRDRNGKPCRYPEHQPRIYHCNETQGDRDLARAIRSQALHLRGLINLRSTLQVLEARKLDGITDEQYLKSRLRSAAGLAFYHVMSNLRSSIAALLEHIYGTEFVCEHFNIKNEIKAKSTGNILQSLRQAAGKPPKNHLNIELPDWLRDPEQHAQACAEEIQAYERIAQLAREISDARSQAKTQLLFDLLSSHNIVIAFDSHLITLSDFHRRLTQHGDCEVVVATGSNETERNRANKLCQLGSNASRAIILCSDAMSEGLNLQQASAVVHLDMPTVVRVAEQRIGRVDRMDSPHPTVEIFWSKDSPEFAPSTDERFFERHFFVSELIGANMLLPEDIIPASMRQEAIVTPEEIIQEIESAAAANEQWDGLQDAFTPVRNLVSGAQALISQAVYEEILGSKARVVSSVSVVEAKYAWSFFCLAGGKWGAPRWVYFDTPKSTPITDLEEKLGVKGGSGWYSINPPGRGRTGGKKFVVNTNNEFINLSVQKSLTIEAVCAWVKTWANSDAKIITPGKRTISLAGEPLSNCSELQTSGDETANKAILKPHSLQIRGVSKPHSLQMKPQSRSYKPH
ncbi:helicase [Chroococcidiopsis sp. CCALA 051]|uniref:SNF2-related protein n=1 Tax=Chroococcidiopsis sp. CCALA 051 TaxID=869949 RepID=UPI000D0D034B|nr:SNF2-related protein [Chroococcidiopsis sp. CCALA 051]PSM48492.1 helicase [Chroococcidiopsis sp. CCALA 051]